RGWLEQPRSHSGASSRGARRNSREPDRVGVGTSRATPPRGGWTMPGASSSQRSKPATKKKAATSRKAGAKPSPVAKLPSQRRLVAAPRSGLEDEDLKIELLPSAPELERPAPALKPGPRDIAETCEVCDAAAKTRYVELHSTIGLVVV